MGGRGKRGRKRGRKRGQECECWFAAAHSCAGRIDLENIGKRESTAEHFESSCA